MNIANLMGNPMIMKAMGAMMRGENPSTVLKNLASTNPQLQGLDLDNLESTAQALCQKNNVNMNELADKIRDFAKSNT